jgi:hypothetical protein
LLQRLIFLALVAGCDSTPETPSGERTLANCATSISSDAPEFFRKYFHCVTVTVNAGAVTVETVDLPPHKSYYWGEGNANYEAWDITRGNRYQPNPNKIASQSVKITVPPSPTARGLTINASLVDGTVGTNANEYPQGPVGVAADGVALFNALAAPGMNIADEQYTFDEWNAHPEMRGAYHYHTRSNGPIQAAGVELIGILCDGTPVLGCSELDGSTPASASFDAQGGHVGTVSDLGMRYHTHVCPTMFTQHPYTPEIAYYSSCQR